ncbi:MAG: hypothetical protein Ct9H300mP27_04620 [Chloroflexota bacterium]|nr:MAG: hypothetical protein Ct9H300mP27_04620 [Chloroflexota bacterium]
MRLILTNCTLIDCVNPDPKPHATVIIRAGRISDIQDGGTPSHRNKDLIIDLKGVYTYYPVCGTSTYIPSTQIHQEQQSHS